MSLNHLKMRKLILISIFIGVGALLNHSPVSAQAVCTSGPCNIADLMIQSTKYCEAPTGSGIERLPACMTTRIGNEYFYCKLSDLTLAQSNNPNLGALALADVFEMAGCSAIMKAQCYDIPTDNNGILEWDFQPTGTASGSSCGPSSVSVAAAIKPANLLTLIGNKAQMEVQINIKGCTPEQISNFSVSATLINPTLLSSIGAGSTGKDIFVGNVNVNSSSFDQTLTINIPAASAVAGVLKSQPESVFGASGIAFGTASTPGSSGQDNSDNYKLASCNTSGLGGSDQQYLSCPFAETVSAGIAMGEAQFSEYSACSSCISGGNIWTGMGCINPTFEGVIINTIRLLLAIGGGLAMLRLMHLGYLYQFAEQDKIKQARQEFFNTLGALVLALFGLLILRFIAVNLLDVVPPGFF